MTLDVLPGKPSCEAARRLYDVLQETWPSGAPAFPGTAEAERRLATARIANSLRERGLSDKRALSTARRIVAAAELTDLDDAAVAERLGCGVALIRRDRRRMEEICR